ncbi:unnamed protein product [Hyaloperonospora brassicae]|uniref:RxLR effector protein n=1 Tax=Hyaloperonospora brassicae TaxID=162125 RepID=A0AAV0U5Q6_HYABA|nr:unnamed protein product [Hyaloperonospora brassicae]
MRLTGLYVAIVMASLHANGSAASTSKDVDAALSENKATSMSVSSPRANEKRSLRAEEKRNLDGLDEDRTLPGPFAESLGSSITRASKAPSEATLRFLMREWHSLSPDLQAKTVAWTYTGVQNKIKTIVQEGRLTKNEGSGLLKGIKLLSHANPSNEPAVWVEGLLLLRKFSVITRKQLIQALEILTGQKFAPSSLGKKLKWAQLEKLKKRQAKL